VASQLTALASYRILQDLPVDDPKLHPSRIVAMPRNGGLLYSVSRIVFAGADHSGRTTPLAHHVLIAVDDLTDERVNLGETIQTLNNLFVDSWNQTPQRFDPPRSIDVTLANGSMPSIGKANSRRLANVTGWLAARFVDGLESNSSLVVFVLPTDQRDDSLKLLAAIHRAIAAAKQSSVIFQSHVSSSRDLIGHAHIVATYPNSEYLNEIQSRPEKRRPPVVDLSTPLPTVFNNVGFARWFERKLADNDSQQTTQKGLRLRESLNDIDESQYPDGFSQVWEFYELINKGCMTARVDEIGKQAETLSAISPNVAGFVVKWTNAAIKDHFKKRQSDSDWHSLLQILVSDSWPKPVRRLCLDAIAEMPDFSFPIALANRDAMQIPELAQQIDGTIETKPTAWKTWLQGAPQHAANCRRYLEGQIASGKLPFSASQQATQILIETGNADQQQQAVRCFLTSPIQSRPISVTHFKWLQSIESENGLLQQVLDSASLPPQIAVSLQGFLHPHAHSGIQATINSQADAEVKLSQEQQSASSVFNISRDYTRTRQVRDPRAWILGTAIATGLLTMLGTAVFVWYIFQDIAKLWTNVLVSAMAGFFISLLIAGVAYFGFSKNRMVSRQRPLMIFGFISVAFMIVSAIAVLGLEAFLFSKVSPRA
jgi:hypothetical protein